MDSNSKQATQTLNQTKKNVLILEARHSISIEVSNSIRSKLNPRLFIPRPKTTTQYCSKSTILRSEVNYKYRNSKILRKNMKRNQKDWKVSLEKPRCKLSNIQTAVTAKENAIRSWGNLEIIENENLIDSERYLKDGEIIFIDDIEDENTRVFDSLQTNVADENSFEHVIKSNSSSSSFPNDEFDSEATTRKKICKSSDFQPKNGKNSKQSNFKSSKKVSSQKLADKVDLEAKAVIETAAAITTKNKPNIFQNSIKSPSKNDTTIANEKIEKNLISKYVVGESLKKFAEEKAIKMNDGKAKSYPPINVINAKENPEQMQPALNIKKAVGSVMNQNLAIKEKAKQLAVSAPNTTNSSKDKKLKKLDSKDLLKYKYIPIKTPLDRDLCTAKTTVTDFQVAVRSSIAFICDCSPIDQKINDDLIELENCVENCSKYLLQSYNDVEEYLRINYMDPRKNPEQNRFKTSSLNQKINTEKTTTETLTIFIETDKMPKKSITYKTSDILYPKLNSYNDETRETPILALKTISQATTNLKGKTSAEATSNSIPANTKQDEMSSRTQAVMEMQQSNKQFSPPRKKVTPLFVSVSTSSCTDSSVTSTQNQISASPDALRQNSSSNINDPNYLKSTIVCTNPYNLIYTQAPNNYNTLMAPTLLNVHATTRRCSPITNQVLTESPVSVTNCYNYSPATENVYTGSIPLNLSKSQTLKQQLSQMPKNNLNRFVYQNSMYRMAYLQYHYNHHSTESNAYNSQSVNNSNTMGATDLPAIGDIQIQKH